MAKQSPIAQLAAKPLKEQIAILVGVMVLLGGLYYQVFYSSLDDDLKSARGQYSREDKKSQKLKVRLTEWQQMVKDKEALDLTLNTNQVSLPTTAALPSFIGNLQRQAAVAGVSFKNWSRMEEVPVTGYVKVPVSVEVVGSFHQILKYFYLLSITQRIITVENFSIKPEKTDSEDVLLKAAFRATTFRQADGAQPAAAEPEAKSGIIEAGKDARAKKEGQLNEVVPEKDNDQTRLNAVDRLKNPGAQ